MLRDLASEVAHYLIVGCAVEVAVDVADLPRFKQDRYCERREAPVYVGQVGHGLPKARLIEKTVALMYDDLGLLIFKSLLVLRREHIEDEKATIMFAGQVVYAAKQLSREVQSVLHPLAPWIELKRKMALLILQVFTGEIDSYASRE